MVKARDILIFGDDWGRYPSTIQHIANVLKKQNRIFWIGSLGLRKPKFTPRDIIRGLEKLANMFKRSGAPIGGKTDNPIVLHPVVIPMHDNQLMRRKNISSIEKTIRTAIQTHKIVKPIILSSSPIVADILDRIDYASAHYFCLDDYGLFDGAFQSLRRHEEDFIKRADSSYFVSDRLLEQHRSVNRELHFLPQGVDVGHFTVPDTDIVPELRTLPRPIIGFFGLLANWIDLPLILRCAQTYPDASFVVIGKAATDTSLLKQSPNIRYIGEVSYEQLPKYVARFDIGLIPFSVNELTLAANPLKLLEYMASGTAVVSTKLPEVEKFSPLAAVAKDSNEFVRLIGAVLNNDTEEQRNRRKAIAQEHSWEKITEQVCAVIERVERTPRAHSGVSSVGS